VKKSTVAAILAALALAVAMAGPAAAKITPVDTSCSNGGGQQVDNKTTCPNGKALTQDTENQNPHGFAPPGWNK
jgi:hypothetical protein